MLIYGLYVILKGRVGASNSTTLYGNPARLIGALYLLPIPIAYISVQIFCTILILCGVSLYGGESFYGVCPLIIEAGSVLLVLYIIIKLSDRLYEKQQSVGASTRLLTNVQTGRAVI